MHSPLCRCFPQIIFLNSFHNLYGMSATITLLANGETMEAKAQLIRAGIRTENRFVSQNCS